MKLNINDLFKYLFARRIGETSSIIDADANDPILLQAAKDGYVDRINDQWVMRGVIQPGETRIVRHTYGRTSKVTG